MGENERQEAARKAAKRRWKDHIKIYEELGISKTALWRYTLPFEHPYWRRMPAELKKKYEKLKAKEENKP